MSALYGLLQGEVRKLVAELVAARTAAIADEQSGEAMARWNRRVRSLDSALKVLARPEWEKLASALIAIGAGMGPPLADPACGEALALLEQLTTVPLEEFEAWLAATAPVLEGLLARLGEVGEAPPPGAGPALLALFRQEVEEQCTRLTQVLLRLDQERDRLELIAPLMRSAHSVKGAARAVRLDAAVALAHELEERLSRAQRAGSAVSDGFVEFALGCVDLLRELARQGATPTLLARWDSLRATDPAQPPAEPAQATTTNPSSSMPPPPIGAPSYIEASDGDPVLRIKASLVGRLIALAGSGVVGAHRLRPFGERQQRLRQSLGQSSRMLDDLHHRLGAPAQSTPVGAELAAMRRQLAASRSLLQSWIEDFSDYAREAFDLNERVYQAAAMTRLRPFRELVLGYPRVVRDLARQLGRKARLSVVGEALEVDRDVLEQLDAPLSHLLRNAIDHGIETPAARVAAGKPEEGQIRIWAAHRAGMLAIDVSDDGNGIDLERVRQRAVEQGRVSAEAAAALTESALREMLFAPGFSTRSQVTDISGRGVGLDAVRAAIERLDGSVRLSTRPGGGTTFHLLVPISRAVTRSLVVRTAGETYAFPSLRIERVVRAARADIQDQEGLQYLPYGSRNVGLVPLAELLELGSTRAHRDRVDLVIAEHQGHAVGFVIDELVGEYDLATRPLDARLGRVADLAAVALLPDASPVILLDVDDLVRSALTRQRARLAPASPQGPQRRRRRVLVADDSISVRELERQLLEGRGYSVAIATDGLDAWTRLRDESFDLLVTDVDMPRMDGIELTRSVKQDPRLRTLPVVIVSYRDRPEDRRRGLEARADSYLTKADFQDEGFLRLVHQLIGGAEGEDA
jgi:two-component system, chemotaxis family, sensor histidine kinase and response regulator WspE